MNTIDIIILICLIPAAIEGLIKGFITEVISIVSLIAGAWLAFRFSEMLCQSIAPYLGNVPEKVIQVVSFALIMIVAVLLLALLAKVLKKVLKIALLGWLDRLLGIVFGIGKAALILSIIIVLFGSLNDLFGWVGAEELGESVLYAPLKDFAYKVFPYFKALVLKQ